MRRWMSTRWSSLFSACAALAALAGCGSSSPSVETSMAEATVKGVIKVKGEPMTSGEITFDPGNYKRSDVEPHTAKIQSDGHYEATTLVGQNTVTLSGPEIEKNPELAYGALSLEVQPGVNTYDVILPPPDQGNSENP